ncbi:hypothetical protein H310_03879 [Aphanomyces invadans]|uniref:DJ-1/PfpI domain-containing protein n=1 Tax=Aphanomyces invadans TaxID=157072 RepID=A0A024UET8_9STRA|nr:hypothetical protein H310_03879 [Aphanomyces invadans]ETW04730.1 hypothetical protein H310_03879 [Aphanomyces invadans]RHY25795.1 hypothetical protein DYB32_008089 [Aphanomyces invadans]|eukprot:XP_008866168.1 hypothetical protein H310_03879 [Aphanomyces invadans]
MATTKQKLLFVLTSHDKLGNTGHPTGWYLPELAHPYQFLVQHYDITVASPLGGVAPLDPSSKEAFAADPDSIAFLNDPVAQHTVANTRKLSSLSKDELVTFVGVVYPGGHGPMFDLHSDAESHRVITTVWENNGVVASVCHGPASVSAVKLSDGSYLVADKNVTGFSNAEEDAVNLTAAMPFLLEDELKQHGARYSKADNMWAEHVVVDGKLITGQNPASSHKFAHEIHRVLSQH